MMTTGLLQDQNLEKQLQKQIGCMSGFLHIFDRQQILAGKRIYSTKRLPPSTVGVTSSPESVKSVKSVKETVRETEPVVPETPDRFQTPPKSPLPLPLFEVKEGSVKSSWKFCKDMPRLSLDSRAIVDSKGSLCPREIRTNDGNVKQQRSPSVIARLMGLEQLPSCTETVKTPELRRSASESRAVSRDLFHSRFVDGNNFQPNTSHKQLVETNLTNTRTVGDDLCNRNTQNGRGSRNQKIESPKTCQWQRRSFFDSGDFFPETTTVQMYGDSEKNLKLRGIDQQSNDLEKLKHILEALQLKGLLHSKSRNNNQRNFVYDSDYPKPVRLKPWRSPAPNRGFGNDYGGINGYGGERSGRSPVRGRNSPNVTRNDNNNTKNCNSIVKRKPLSIETRRTCLESSESRRSSPINSPKLTPKRTGSRSGSDYPSVTNRSPRNRKPKEKFVMEDESSSFSESTGSTTSQSDLERSKMEEYREGKSLLERCDKLLHSIAEMNSSMITTESQPSPVSVLDSAFDKDESSSPSPVMKRSIDFKDLTVDLEDDIWSSIISPTSSTKEEDFISDDSDFTYISEILRASKYLPDDSSVFFFLEKQQYLTGNDASKGSKLRRKLIFDIVVEILDRNRQLPPWNIVSESINSLKQICSEFNKIRERETADNLLDLICGVLKKDLAGNSGWGDQPVEMSESVLDIERLIFKDLVSETIRDLAEFSGKSIVLAPRRKLVF